MGKRLLSMILCISMFLSMVPAPAYAEVVDVTEKTSAVENTAATVTETPEVTTAPSETEVQENTTEYSETEDTEPAEETQFVSYTNQSAVNSVVSNSGTYGGDINWSVQGTVLTISGNGDMGLDGSYWSPGWSGYRFTVETVIIEPGVTTISYGAFHDFEVLNSVTIPNTVTTIEGSATNPAFSNCPQLKELFIPASVTSIGPQNLPSLEAYRVDAENPVYSSDSSGVLFDKDKSQLIRAPQTISGSYSIPDGVVLVDDGAFDNCTGLTELLIPQSVMTMGRISGCSGLKELTLPSSLVCFGGLAYCDGITELEIPGTVYCFEGLRSCDGIKELVIPDSVTELGICIDCKGLERVKLPKNITQLPNNMFSSCSALTQVEIPAGVTSIGWGAFQDCTSLRSITIPEGITILADSMFRGSGVSEVILPQSLTSISTSGAFWGCKNLKEIVLPENLEHIGVSAFLESGLERITIPASVKSFGDYVFSDCHSLKEITFLGDAPEFGDDEDDVFENVTATAYYPAGNTTWDSKSKRNHGGTITWKASCGSHTLGDVSYTWTANNAKCTASKPCTVTGCEYALTETVSSTSVTEEPSCTIAGKTTYAASFTTAGFAGQTQEVTLPATGHDWIDPLCSLDKVCASCGAEEGPKDHTFVNNVCVDCSTPGGTCGENIGWILDAAGTLTLTGTGDMSTYGTGNYAPWNSVRQKIKSVVIGEGITAIGNYAFYNAANLKTVTFHGNGPSIGENAFLGVTAEALYPSMDNTWKNIIQQNFGGNLTWKPDGPILESVTVQTMPTKTMYQVGDVIDLTGLTLLATYSEGEAQTVEAGDVAIVSGDTSASGKVTVTVAYFDKEAEFEILVHTVYQVGEVLQPSSGYPQSAHAYPNNANLTYSYTVEGAEYLKLTFSSSTRFESRYDFLYIYDGTGKEIGTYSGTDLAAKTIKITGDTVKFKLTSDSSSTYYGFAFSSIYANFNNVVHEASDEGIYTNPQCFVDGYTTHTCHVCDETYVVQDTGSAAHAFADGYCSICGVPEGLTTGGPVNETVSWAMMADGTLHITGTGIVTGGTWKNSVKTATALVIHSGITEIAEAVFSGFTALTSVEMKEGLTVIGRRAFDSCTSLTTVSIPSTVTTVVYRAFYNCTALTGVYTPDLTAWCNITFGENTPGYYANPLYYAGNLYIDGQLLTDLVIPESITELKTGTFYGCKTLTSVTVHPGVTAIGDSNFSYSDNLASVYISDLAAWCAIRFEYSSSSPTYKAKALTLNGQVITDLVIPEGIQTLGGYNFAYCTGITSVTIPESVTSIGAGVFSNCIGLTELEIPSGVTQIGAYAFSSCYGLTELEIPEGITVLNNSLVSGCSALKSIKIPESVTEIQNYVFSYCNALTAVEIPSGVTKIGDYAFRSCTGLTSLELPAALTQIGSDAFYSCTGLTEIVIPGNVREIGSYAFQACSGLTSVTLFEGLWHIDDSAFSGCTGLTGIVIPASVSTVGMSAFSGCTGMTQIRFCGNAPSINSNAFRSVKATVLYPYDASGWTNSVKTGYGGTLTWRACSNAESIAQGTCGDTAIWSLDAEGTLLISGSGAMPDYSTSGGKTTAPWFVHVKSIRKVVVDLKITYMGNYAFYGCSNLTDIVFMGSKPNFASNTFYGVRATACYQANESTWHPDEVANYGGTITWKPVGMSEEHMAHSDRYSSFQWHLDYDGTLTISSDYVSFPDYTGFGSAPWYPYRNHLKKVVITGNINYVGSLAFYYCTELREVVFESNVSYINERAFQDCEKLEIIQLNQSLSSIGKLAFYGCESLKSIYIPSDYPTTIGDYAFGNCKGLTEVSIPTYITMGKGVFEYCSNLRTVYINDSEGLYGFVVDATCFTGVTANVIYPTGSCSASYMRDNYGGTLTWIEADYGKCGPDARWSYNTDTKVLTISGSGQVYTTGSGGSMPWGPRRNDIQSIQVAYGISGLSRYVFEYCENAVSVTLPESLTRLHLSAFNDCGSLNNLILPSSLEYIDDNFSGFIRCESLSDMYYFGTEDEFTRIKNYEGIRSNNSSMTKHFLVLGPGTATCTEAGYRPYYQYDDTSVYDSKYDLNKNKITSLTTVSALGHNTVTQQRVEATCTETGLTEGSCCSRCGKIFVAQEKIPLKEHAWSDWTTEAEASCTEDGLERRDCADCEAFEEQPVPSPGHTEIIDPGVEPTCTETGLTEGKHCEFCSEILVDQEVIPATDHSFEYGTCLNCGALGTPDHTLAAGKYMTLKHTNPETGKPYTTKQITWFMDAVYAPYATITAAGKLTAKKVVERARVIVVGTVIGEENVQVILSVDIYPTVTHVDILENNEDVVNGQTRNMDFDEESRTFTVLAHPLDTAQNVTWSISGDKMNRDGEYSYANYTIDGNTLTVTEPKRKVGTVTVKATVDAGVKKTVSFKLSFADFAESVTITNTEKTVVAGNSLQLAAVVTPNVVTKAGVTWSLKNAEDKTVASISSTGLLKTKTVYRDTPITVVATTKDGTKSAVYTVTITPKDTGMLILTQNNKNVTKSTVSVNLNTESTISLVAENLVDGSVAENITWKSSNTRIASVKDGEVQIHGKGSVIITASEMVAEKEVRSAAVTLKISALTGTVTIEEPEGGLEVASGKSITLKAVCEGGTGTVTWSIIGQGTQYAKIAKNGRLTANKDITSAKEVKVVATAADGSEVSSAPVTVIIRPLAQGVQIYSAEGGRTLFSIRSSDNLWVRSNTTLEWARNDAETLQLYARVYPCYEEGGLRNAIQGVTWKSSSPKIASVDEDGLVTCHKPGTVTITATAIDGSTKSVSFKLKVINKIESLHMDPQKIMGGRSLNLLSLLKVNPTDATYKTFDWEIIGGDGAAYASINAKGNLKTKKVTKPMEVEIRVTAQDISKEKAEFIVTIQP